MGGGGDLEFGVGIPVVVADAEERCRFVRHLATRPRRALLCCAAKWMRRWSGVERGGGEDGWAERGRMDGLGLLLPRFNPSIITRH